MKDWDKLLGVERWIARKEYGYGRPRGISGKASSCPGSLAGSHDDDEDRERLKVPSSKFRLNGKGRSWKYAPGTNCQDRSNVSIEPISGEMVLWIPSCMSEVGRDSQGFNSSVTVVARPSTDRIMTEPLQVLTFQLSTNSESQGTL